MEATRIQRPLDTPVVLIDEASTGGEAAAMVQSGVHTMDVDSKGEPLQWQASPVLTTSLLPPFGVSQPSHLPTPQSPGNLAGYLTGPGDSPLSSNHLRAGPSRQFATFRPPSRPQSAQPPKTPQRESTSSTPKISPRTFSSPFRPDINDKGSNTDLRRLYPSQIATPSPERTKARRASNTPSDTETITTPSAHQQRNPTLAPAPIISPTNSSHSTIYHASPEFHSSKYTRPGYVSHNMSTLSADHNLQGNTQGQSTHNLADPFVVIDDEARKDGSTNERYQSPPFSRNQHHHSVHGSASPLPRARAVGHGEAIARLVLSPGESLEAPSFGLPVKAEVEDSEYDMVVRTPRSAELDGARPSQAPTSPRTPPPLGSARSSQPAHRTPPLEQSVFRTPPRVAGGEIERIRQRQADLTDARAIESEKHRPDYLVRAQRTRNDLDDEDAPRGRENVLTGLGVTVSPAKGRRLKLYRPVAGGAVTSVEDLPPEPDDGEPKTPPPLNTAHMSVPAMSMRAINWRTPRQRRASPVIWTEEDEIQKQRRLAAFAAPKSSHNRRRLKPVDIPGQGRVVIDVASEETRALAEAGILDMPPPDSLDDAEFVLSEGYGAHWPDSEYPWSLREQQRYKEQEAEKRKRLLWIERFLDRESESEEDEYESAAGPSTGGPPAFDIETPSHTQSGRGKTASLKAIPGSRQTPIVDRRVFRTANADAREALLSKKHVREVSERIRRRKAAEEEEGVVMCICQGADDGRPMVRCDECRTWYHLVCMDIADESELGDEWFCWKCVPSAEDPPPPPVFEPTFAPVMPDTPPRTSVGDLPLYQTALQPSPILDVRVRAPVSPSVPTHFSRDRDHERSPSWRPRLPHMLGDPDDPVRGGPSTPYHARSTDSRLYSTPKFYDDYVGDEYIPFDPTSTPSRGLKFPNPAPITPRRPPAWPGQGLLWATPSVLPRTPQFSQTPSSSTRSLTYSLSTMEDSGGPFTSPWPSDESPVRRPHKPNESNYPYPPPRRLLESPLAVRGGGNRPFLPGVEESPTARYIHRGKDRDLGELTAIARGQSPRRE